MLTIGASTILLLGVLGAAPPRHTVVVNISNVSRDQQITAPVRCLDQPLPSFIYHGLFFILRHMYICSFRLAIAITSWQATPLQG